MAADPLIHLVRAATAAHDGVHGNASDWWTAWNLEPEVLAPAALAGFFYLRGLDRWRERSRSHPWWRTAFYFAGLAVLVLALESPVDYLGEHHLTFHMLQHELLLMVAAPLILLGAPTTPMLLGLPSVVRMRVIRPVAKSGAGRRLYRLLTHPLVAVGLLTVMLAAWHLAPGWYDAALEGALLHDVQHLSYAVAGMLFWWNVIDPMPLRAVMGYPLRMLYLLIGGTPKHFVAAAITLASEPLYDAYVEVEPVFALSPLDDQAIGGLIMWFGSQLLHVLAIGVVFAVWAAASEEGAPERAVSAGSAPPVAD